MTLLELLVVLAIFGILSTVVIFNYGNFQSEIYIKNLASDIALQVVTAQKSAVSGLLPSQSYSLGWKPSYGVYFSTVSSLGADNKDFIYFTDLNSDGKFDGSSCPATTGECISKYTITNNNSISNISVACPVRLALVLPEQSQIWRLLLPDRIPERLFIIQSLAYYPQMFLMLKLLLFLPLTAKRLRR